MAVHSPFYPVKLEDTPSPHLSPTPPHFHFKFHHPHWLAHNIHNIHPHMSYSDDYDDLNDLPTGVGGYPQSAASAAERQIRRRSSKACDQCRKSKCKCERGGPNEACKSCLMLGTACTFLGPSRKRGPPKGYIDAIEARLHQTEALLGIMLATNDNRAQSLLRDIGKDPLAKEIITRVDNSPYGVKGRKREDIALSVGGNKLRSGSQPPNLSGQAKTDPATPLDLTSTHPSNEWQDTVSAMLNAAAGSAGAPGVASSSSPNERLYSPAHSSSDGNVSPGGRRTRRRLGNEDYTMSGCANSAPGSAVSLLETGTTAARTTNGGSAAANRGRRAEGEPGDRRSESVDRESVSLSEEEEEEITGAVGQLSLNEDEQVRYHGKASGLHLLGNKERVDHRNEGGIWRFPKARVWPPLPSGSKTMHGEDEFVSQLPAKPVQERLLDLYFTYVHPIFPILHKQSFFEAYKAGTQPDSPQSPTGPNALHTSPFNRRARGVPSLLLFAMFALASRYDPSTYPYPPDPSMMWGAGDEYLDRAKVILDSTYSSSRSPTVQALLLMGYREIGIGAMAQAWTYIGMGIRMAQDLGMHRSADGWERVGLGGRLFGEAELKERKRVWFGCVIMDKYVSTYIGRPLMIYERDFDTTLPREDDSEELEEWSVETPLGKPSTPLPGRVISCFNASATLSGILSKIVQSIYAVRLTTSRHAEAVALESLLDKWYIDLPDHLRYDPASAASPRTSKAPTPLPNVLTLHMQYWCAVVLLHRPFIRHALQVKKCQQPEDPTQVVDEHEAEVRSISERSYELCNAAANHITSIVSLYQEKYLLDKCSVFLCYYVFTASIMHDTTLNVHPNDPQARLGLQRCLNALRVMRTVWPAAARALELFGGAKDEAGARPTNSSTEFLTLTHPLANTKTADRIANKRAAEHSLDDTFSATHPHPPMDGTTPSQSQFEFVPSTMRHGASAPSQQQQLHAQQPRQQHHFSQEPEGVFTGDGGFMPAPPVAPASVALANNPAYWPNSDLGTSFNAPLSTAVLPQLYSTGLVDDVSVGGHGHGHHHQSHSREYGQAPPPHHGHSHSHSREYAHLDHPAHSQAALSSARGGPGGGGRYAPPPQYFDYSSYGQAAAAGFDMQEGLPPHSQPHPHQQQQHQSQMYSMADQYGLYGNQTYNNR